MAVNAAERSLRRSLPRLAGAMDPVVISTALFAQELLDQRAWEEARAEAAPDYDKNLRVLEAVMRAVRIRPAAIEQFMAVLGEEHATRPLADELRVLYDSLRTADEPGAMEAMSSSKRSLVKGRRIEGDGILMEVAREVGRKWEEVGIALGLSYATLSNEVGTWHGGGEHMRAFRMLQCWKNTAGADLTYDRLATALTASGLATTAWKHC